MDVVDNTSRALCQEKDQSHLPFASGSKKVGTNYCKGEKSCLRKLTCTIPDKAADRIAGAIVDIAYKKQKNPKIAVEVLIGHGHAFVTVESSVRITREETREVVKRIAHIENVKLVFAYQDKHLAENQHGHFRCGDNGIFRGVPVTEEQKQLTQWVIGLSNGLPFDGKYIINDTKLICCQSNINSHLFKVSQADYFANLLNRECIVNPLGDWTGGSDVDSGATNRKLGSDMGDSVTGGGLHGKDLSKADVSVNIYAFWKAQKEGRPVELSCAIGDEFIDGRPYGEIVLIARKYIEELGGFEKFAEWGLIR